MEALSRILLNVQVEGNIWGIRVSQNGPHINHLFFADDGLLFVRNKKEEAKVVCDILCEFERILG